MSLKEVFILLIFAMLTINAEAEMLRGVTIGNWPYSAKIDGKYEGFAIDLINEIADFVGFEYKMYYAPDGFYGRIQFDKPTGMIGEVYNNKADFAISDITVTDERKNYIDFTEPFMESKLVILINKNNSIKSFEELAQQSHVKYGTFKGGATYKLFSISSDPTLRKMYLKMATNADYSAKSPKENLEKVIAGSFAFIGESATAEFLIGKYCDLTYIEDKSNNFVRYYAIGLPKHSVYKNLFSNAISQLKASGWLDRLKEKYWPKRC